MGGLVELSVRDLGVIADLRLVLGPGMTALTGETGAGKTLVVEAIELLMGGRADSVLVRPGADEARVEARFATGASEAGELVLARAVPAAGGRSRAYVNGRMAPVLALAELGAG
ncbi:MAG: AAA family ATPase, partial [Acidimicrobiales bacterium]